jgi:hypothetical protein
VRRVPASTADGGGPKGKPSTCAASGSAGPRRAGFKGFRVYTQDTVRWQRPAISLRCSDEAQQLLAVWVRR